MAVTDLHEEMRDLGTRVQRGEVAFQALRAMIWCDVWLAGGLSRVLQRMDRQCFKGAALTRGQKDNTSCAKMDSLL